MSQRLSELSRAFPVINQYMENHLNLLLSREMATVGKGGGWSVSLTSAAQRLEECRGSLHELGENDQPPESKVCGEVRNNLLSELRFKNHVYYHVYYSSQQVFQRTEASLASYMTRGKAVGKTEQRTGKELSKW